MANHEHWMGQALKLAEQGINTTTPNPAVGCVLIGADGSLVGQGYHQQAGGPHAEVFALRDAGDKARGATAYVTLEPCNHQGRTGPCSQALIDAGIKTLVYAMQDPNPLVCGQGLARLRAAGVEVIGPYLEAEARELNRGFIKRMTQGRPFLTCKLAMSLDGRTAMANGQSKWITGPAAREDVQTLRARSCAIITGAGTVLADNPSLTWRCNRPAGVSRQPVRIVLDRHLRTPVSAAILQEPGTTWLISPQTVAANSPLAPFVKNLPDELPALMDWLGAEGCNQVLLEAGAKLAGRFLAARLIDELVVYLAPTLMGSRALPLFDLQLDHMSERIGLSIQSVSAVGVDLKITAVPKGPHY
ncbi:MAG TPA: bifunctional diaminohydroxyphosphoribosylaminopyrimidine deaminase/5-amino-6-(5-phosphoribosylamino)uracil reductase RibD [Cellvibrionaceae bacterium]|nr:bifunctional diaminohydroxyphosphoribosylaminopyrimidine deaminase/5-amino-6-(5-phosphoribosylamino)uracil reductase RibD [Cellvibrionaceae bacterium]HMW49974.1 bifunctional diaminohydroxyphosphoribosylaminopyrimidine deaminase/5-amino-6-(5-phosphoribosylamino)uracil reductase RibD [Cellvibrionaceae bacterium]HMW72772.1 bifunctional diaminohydroxyphosphoribosylaminopyrimidine deaminase/5-amino-6-(5-phosphoribosylamino)uracil reductase RibD [Cellvibrionaceae bacterium]HMY40533.1 bifunctional d